VNFNVNFNVLLSKYILHPFFKIKDYDRHNEFVVNNLEGAISGKKAVGRPRLQYLKQVARNTAAASYTAVKRMACSSSRWKAANQSKD